MASRRGRLHEEDLLELPIPSRLARARAREVISLMRSDKAMSLTRAAALKGTDPRTVRKYFSNALLRTPSGEWKATEWDRHVRRAWVPTRHGPIVLPVQDSRSAAKLARYWEAVKRFGRSEDPEVLKPFRNQSIQVHGEKYDFVTDPRLLKNMLYGGEIGFEELYPITT